MHREYDDLFNSIGIYKQEEREIVLDFLRHLGSIVIKNKKNKKIKREEDD